MAKEADVKRLLETNICATGDLKEANRIKADLSDADLESANLHRANLSDANLTGAVLRDAQIDFADFTNAKLCNTVMPDGQRIFKDC